MALGSGRRFDRAFKDYKEVTEYDETGKKHVKVVYYGTYYRVGLDDRMRRIRKILISVFILMGLGFIIAASSLNIASNQTVYVTIFTALIIVLTLIIFGFAYYYITSPAEMDRRHFIFNHRVFPKLTLAAAILSVAMCISTIVSYLTDGTASPLYFLSMILCLAAAVCYFLIWFIEQKMPYITRNATESDEEYPDPE